jgi:hypothetical protein
LSIKQSLYASLDKIKAIMLRRQIWFWFKRNLQSVKDALYAPSGAFFFKSEITYLCRLNSHQNFKQRRVDLCGAIPSMVQVILR